MGDVIPIIALTLLTIVEGLGALQINDVPSTGYTRKVGGWVGNSRQFVLLISTV